MTGNKAMFFDTAPFIYFIEGNEQYCMKVRNIIGECLNQKIKIITSTITYAEFCIKPYQLGKFELINIFDDLISELKINVIEINRDIAKRAAKLLSEHFFFKSMDAIQLAVCLNYKCSIFLTNDKQLKKIQSINSMLIDDWKNQIKF